MNAEITKVDWLSLHLYLPVTQNSQSWIWQQLAPVLQQMQQQGTCQQWFFIRYWHGGPHLRVRLANVPTALQQDVQLQLQQLLLQLKDEPATSRDDYYRQHKFDGETLDAASLPWFGHCTLVKTAYEPEFNRYGGAQSIYHAEQLFCASSRWVMTQLAQPVLSSQLLTLGWQNMVFSARRLLPQHTDVMALGKYFANYARFWQQFEKTPAKVAVAIQQLLDNKGDALASQLQQIWQYQTPSAFDADSTQLWSQALQQCQAAWLQDINTGVLQMPYLQTQVTAQTSAMALQSLTGSLLHMTNNRLGIAPAQEYQLALLISTICQEASVCNSL